jgi:3-deoxy-D-manno-octulosonate 8-phosphate phosphatase (KDO 8-P phosphatase)
VINQQNEEEGTLRERAAAIRLVVFDVDGVLTDGKLLLGPGGEEFKMFHVHDGLGLVMLRESGIEVAVISSRESRVVAERMADLGIEYVFQGRGDKRSALASLLTSLQLPAQQVAYVGDDLVDLPPMGEVGLAIAVANARPQVKQRAHWVTGARGGDGAAREVCEMLLQARGLLDAYSQRHA